MTTQTALTVVYVHGLGNKPVASVLKNRWDEALFGFDVGERSRLAYWVDRQRYPEPEPAAVGPRVAAGAAGGGVLEVAAGLPPLVAVAQPRSKAGRRFARLVARYEAAAEMPGEDGARAQFFPIGRGARRSLTRWLTRQFARDAYDFFFDQAKRRAMTGPLEERLAAGGPFVVIAHSQGSMIAYEVLQRLSRSPAPPDIALLMTVGSPLGIEEVKEQLEDLTAVAAGAPSCVRRWVNVADRLDPIALDTSVGGDYSGRPELPVEDLRVENPDRGENPHSITGYLRSSGTSKAGVRSVRAIVADEIDTRLFQPVARFATARDLVRRLEDGEAEERHEVLLEIAADASGNVAPVRDQVLAVLRGLDLPEEPEALKRFVAARLTRGEVERLAAELGPVLQAVPQLSRLWRDSEKLALLETSIGTVQAMPAHLGYGARGQGICWGVLDTGIADHPHFASGRIRQRFDCTQGGPPLAGQAVDRVGHGTHVAGIISGRYTEAAPAVRSVTSIAPLAELAIFKVLDDQGRGRDSWIIKALDHIAALNEAAGSLVIHGLNLSLGGGFDQDSFGCGHSPICRELRRLHQQGLAVVVAAGNQGYVWLSRADGAVVGANLPLSINDPANLDEAIVVGSVNKTNPHLFGPSYFSSRGPTADGRQKPDCVAPGERILSCRYDAPPSATAVEELYVEMSGTSMAAPHVSGILAAFLSQRREFIGYPDRLKRILVENCTDLGRDRAHQGAGLPNLVRMLLAT